MASAIQYDLSASLARGADFLARAQLASGEFATYRWASGGAPDGAWASSPFASALVLHCLHAVADPRIPVIAAAALTFLESEMEAPGVWRFWSASSRWHRSVPPDVDDTCCASYALRLYGHSVPDNAQLLAANASPDGRFYTWFAPRRAKPAYVPNPEALVWLLEWEQWRDIDPVVNANALLYLGEGRAAGAVDCVLETLVAHAEATCSQFYPDALSFYYMLSRALAAGAHSLARVADTIVGRTLERQAWGGSFGSAMHTALAANVLLNLGYAGPALDRATADLIQSQGPDGAWPAATLFVEPDWHYGSSELTTAFCLEALSRVQRLAV